MLMFHPDLTRVTFFDLEFYVPENERLSPRNDLRANPFKDNHFLIGGVFADWHPLKNATEPAFTEHWIWNYEESEPELLRNIYKHFLDAWDEAYQRDDQCDPMVCGIGIGRVDIGYLFSRCMVHSIASPSELFSVFYRLRVIDLENAGIALFKSTTKYLYPKTTHQLLQKSRIDRNRDPGTTIWDAYDKEQYETISKRTNEEVRDIIAIYHHVLKNTWQNNLAPKYAPESLESMKAGLKDATKIEEIASFFRFEPDQEAPRFVLKHDRCDESNLRLSELIFESGYWHRKKKRKPGQNR